VEKGSTFMFGPGRHINIATPLQLSMRFLAGSKGKPNLCQKSLLL